MVGYSFIQSGVFRSLKETTMKVTLLASLTVASLVALVVAQSGHVPGSIPNNKYEPLQVRQNRSRMLPVFSGTYICYITDSTAWLMLDRQA